MLFLRINQRADAHRTDGEVALRTIAADNLDGDAHLARLDLIHSTRAPIRIVRPNAVPGRALATASHMRADSGVITCQPFMLDWSIIDAVLRCQD